MDMCGFRSARDDDGEWIRSRLARDLSLSLELEGHHLPSERLQEMADGFYEQLVPGPAPNAIFVAEAEGGGRAGFVWVMRTRDENSGTDLAFVLDIHVEEAHRGRGVGSALMERAEAWAKEMGLTRIGLAVSEGNDVAIRLYHSKGYGTKRRIMDKSL